MRNRSPVLLSYMAFDYFYVFGNFWHTCKKVKPKDFEDAIVQNQEYCLPKNFGIGTLRQKLALYHVPYL